MNDRPIQQREHFRIPMESRVLVERGDGLTLAGICINISMGGMCLSLEDELSHSWDGIVKMLYQHAEGDLEFVAKFTVAWVGGSEKKDVPFKYAGIRFVEIDDENRGRLTRIIISRLTQLENNQQSPESSES